MALRIRRHSVPRLNVKMATKPSVELVEFLVLVVTFTSPASDQTAAPATFPPLQAAATAEPRVLLQKH